MKYALTDFDESDNDNKTRIIISSRDMTLARYWKVCECSGTAGH